MSFDPKTASISHFDQKMKGFVEATKCANLQDFKNQKMEKMKSKSIVRCFDQFNNKIAPLRFLRTDQEGFCSLLPEDVPKVAKVAAKALSDKDPDKDQELIAQLPDLPKPCRKGKAIRDPNLPFNNSWLH